MAELSADVNRQIEEILESAGVPPDSSLALGVKTTCQDIAGRRLDEVNVDIMKTVALMVAVMLLLRLLKKEGIRL